MIQDIKITATNPIEFFKVAQEAIIRGARYKGNTFVSLTSLPLMAELELEVEDPENQWKDNGPHIWAIPIPVTIFKKEYLESLEWTEFKEAVKTQDVSGRDRTLMLRKYLEVTNQQN